MRPKETHSNVGGVTADGKGEHEQRQAGAFRLSVQVQLRQPRADCYGQVVWGQLCVQERGDR